MKKVEGSNVHWWRLTDSQYGAYGPWYARREDLRTIGVILGEPNKEGVWTSFVCRPKDPDQRMYASAGSLERAKYFVESWAKYHQHKVYSNTK
jgi:hypothetical protein